MHANGKKRPTAGVVRYFKRPQDPCAVEQQQKAVVEGLAASGGQTQQQGGNPSKRHRERLNTELEAVAALLPFEPNVIARLDKLSVLRLAVSYLEAKTLFQVLQQRHYARWPFSAGYASAFFNPRHFAQEQTILKALGGFLLILNENGDIMYATENIETLLGFHQSDTLHQPIFDMVHSEDRDDLRRMLCWNYTGLNYMETPDFASTDGRIRMERQTSVRFRCFLDNTCGFMRVDIRGRLVILESCLPHCYVASRPEPNFPIFGLLAVCIPLVMPSHVDASPEEPFLRSKHTLCFNITSADQKLLNVFEVDDGQLSAHALYGFVDPADLALVAEAHKQVIQNGAAGLLVYRIISKKTHKTYWFQTSCRLMTKNGKPDSIACSHRLLTEYEGAVLLSKRSSLAAKVLLLEDNMSAAASASILYGTPTLNAAAPQQMPDQQLQQHLPPDITASKPSTIRIRGGGKRVRINSNKNHQRSQANAQAADQCQQPPDAIPASPYFLYPPEIQATPPVAQCLPAVSTHTSAPANPFLPCYLPVSTANVSPSAVTGLQLHETYADQMYILQNASHQQGIQAQQQQGFHTHDHLQAVQEQEMHQLQYQAHQYAGALPAQYYAADNMETKQTTLANGHQHGFGLTAEQNSATGTEYGANAVWFYTSAQTAYPTHSNGHMDHRTKPTFSIHEVTNTLLGQ